MAKLEKRYADNPAWQLTLDDNQLQKLGTIFAVWGQIDFQIIMVIGAILKIEMSSVVALLDNVTSGTLLNHLWKQRDKVTDAQVREELRQFYERMGALIEKRNHLSHGIWGWHVAPDGSIASPACQYHKASASPIAANDLDDICKRVMAESHAIHTIARHFLKLPPNPKNQSVPFFFGLAEARAAQDWIVKSPLQPGKHHHKPR